MTRNILQFIILGTVCACLTACGGGNDGKHTDAIDKYEKAKGDNMVYGLACDGCTDSTIVFLPNAGGDPVTYNIIRATRKGQIFGHPEIGDWVGIMLNPSNKHEASMVIDLDQLKGSWTYTVMPTLKDMATKSEKEIEEELTDSMKEMLFVPKEYGFTLKRHFMASSIGMLQPTNALMDESIVEYPPVRIYTEWHVYNGKLILTGDTLDSKRHRLPEAKVVRDTATFVYMLGDSLALEVRGNVQGFRRQESPILSNKNAR